MPPKFQILYMCVSIYIYIFIYCMALLIKNHLPLTCLRSHSRPCYLLCQLLCVFGLNTLPVIFPSFFSSIVFVIVILDMM